MNQNALNVVTMSMVTAALLLATMPNAPAFDGATGTTADTRTSHTTHANHVDHAASTSTVPYNRRIASIGFSPADGGRTNVHVDYAMVVGQGGETSDLSADILVEILIGGTVASSDTFPGQFDFLANDAIICVNACASDCGSIFGDGVCAGCDCDYSRSGSVPMIVPAGATVRASVRSFGAEEIFTADDALEVVFGAPIEPCDADIDGNGFVDVGDLLKLLANWGPCL